MQHEVSARYSRRKRRFFNHVDFSEAAVQLIQDAFSSQRNANYFPWAERDKVLTAITTPRFLQLAKVRLQESLNTTVTLPAGLTQAALLCIVDASHVGKNNLGANMHITDPLSSLLTMFRFLHRHLFRTSSINMCSPRSLVDFRRTPRQAYGLIRAYCLNSILS